ncbi:MAG: glycoside hydrolase family 9 protein [Fimbriimonas sp.]
MTLTLLTGVLLIAMQASDQIKVCQVGYLPSESKFAMLTADATGNAVIRRVLDNRSVVVAKIGEPTVDASSGDTVRLIDFSSLKEPGVYRVEVEGVGKSFDFRVGEQIFAYPFRLAMRSFLGQRCGTAVSLAPDFPQYHYDACHMAPAQFHASSGKTGTKDMHGGWHDAGDFGKYVVNSGITTGTLLWAYELNEKKLKNLNLDLPESGGKTPDMLAEIRWNLDWMLKMQDDDGGAWHKETTANFPGFIMPDEDKSPTLIIGNGQAPFKVTAATADLVAVAAIGARLYPNYDRAFANKCLAAAEKGWTWLQANKDNNYGRNPAGIGTGGYGDSNPSDERLWAAAELFRTTGHKEFTDYFLANYTKWKPTVQGDAAQGWPELRNMAMWSYAMAKGANRSAANQIKTDSLKAADAIAARIVAHPYRMPLQQTEYYWGSNAVVANYAMMLQIANRFKPEVRYRDGALDSLHYLLGRNTFNTSFVTHVGTKWAMNPHHRPSAADKIEQPWPGLIVGGPNSSGKLDKPARQWKDEAARYDLNENAINWNAPLVFILAEELQP